MALRSTRERVIQTLFFEIVGIALVAPVYGIVSEKGSGESVAMIVAISLVILGWSPLHNIFFDLIELRCAGRTACQRPHPIRVMHAISHEVSAVLVTCPMLMWIGGHTLGEALMLNVGLTMFYTGYAYLFHLAFDRLRPVKALS